jgi:hypothetical protein
VEGNGNEKACEKDFTPWYFAGIDITAGFEENPFEYNKVKYNHACGNLGCNGSDGNICEARERNYWDENVNNEGNCASLNEWENNTVCPECTPGP